MRCYLEKEDLVKIMKPTKKNDLNNESFHLSYMWISILALITCLIVGYFGSVIISCFRGKSNEVPAIYLSPIRTRVSKKQAKTEGQKGKYRTIKVEINERSSETGLKMIYKTQHETLL
ncbi:uncharacterized protein TNCT_99972 [Trichonephila clavata]|uniref:Uncharacterized protein n=1 Tax=Trichonephila clavata TaxID=2740835 RepID=A0A8X6GQW1_TRICU|nr:uncharacterized protein TNCT_99972 [Trichonephila clavata]